MSDGHPLAAASIGILLFAAGLALAGSTYLSARRHLDQRQAWYSADGVVTEVFPPQSKSGVTGLISFAASNGQHYSFTIRDAKVAKGAHVAVIYPIYEPREAQIDPGYRAWLRVGLAGAASVAMVVLGAYTAWYARRWEREHGHSRA